MKKILLGTACLVAVAAAGFGDYTYYENQQMDPWLKANIAALSSGEAVAIPCVPVGESCPFDIVNANGQKGTMTITDHRAK